MVIKRNFLWILFFLFAVTAIYFHEGESLFISNGPYPFGKYIAWFLFFAFLLYSIYCSSKESLFKTVRSIYPMLWARQIGIDLYLGLVISTFLIYLNEDSLFALAFWIVPNILFANLSVLLYVAMNYDSLISHFL